MGRPSLTRGYCWGIWPSKAFFHGRPGSPTSNHSLRRGFSVLDDDLTGTLTLLEARECYFAGADLPAVGSALRGFGAEGADRSGTLLVEKAPALDGDGSYRTPWRPPAAATPPWVASTPKVRRMWWPRPRQRSTTTRRRTGCVKGVVRRRENTPRVKEARPCEDTLEARTKRGVTIIPLKSV
jgi:hypothetical protein